MTLTKEIVVDKIEVFETGAIQVREASYLVEDGVRGALLGYHRRAYGPSEAVDHSDARVQAIARVVRK